MTLPKLNGWSLDPAILDAYLLKAGGTLTGFLTLHAAPTADLHAATKKYVDDTVGGAPFRFSANKNGTNQTGVEPVTWTQLTFGTEVFDDGGFYATGTGRFTPPADRAFKIYAQATFSAGMGDAEQMRIAIYKNGTLHRAFYSATSSTTMQTVATTATLKGNGTDYFDIRVYASGEGNKTVSGAASDTYFEAVSG